MPNFNGSAGADIFTGGAEADTAVGNGGDDNLSGAGGNDLLVGNAGADTLNGGDGDDSLYAGDQSPPYSIPSSLDPFIAPLLDTGTDVDRLIGGDGNDRIFAGFGDNVDGGADGFYGDYLYISFLGAPTGVTVDFRQITQVVGGGTITGIENISWIQGSDFDDNINAGSRSKGYPEFGPVFGMGGNDLLIAGYFTGSLFGGDGDDVLDGRAGQYLNFIDGGPGNDLIYSIDNISTYYGGGGDDTIYSYSSAAGGSGDDLIIVQSSYYGGSAYGEAGDDEIRSSDTDSWLVGGEGSDTLTGGAGADWIFSADEPDRNLTSGDISLERDHLLGMGGIDRMAAGYGDDVDGGSGTDTLYLSLGGAKSGVTLNTTGIVSGQPFVLGGGTIRNVEAIGYIGGSNFADTLTIGSQASEIEIDAADGDDVIIGSNAPASVQGGAGNDRFASGASGDFFDGGLGVDTVDYGAYAGGVAVSLATGLGPLGDQLMNVENVVGSQFADHLTGADGNNLLDGGQGDDTLVGGLGDDTLIGGGGRDTAVYASAATAVTVDLSVVVGQNTGQGVDSLEGIENLVGSQFDDALTGDGASNSLSGGGGNDTLNGGSGLDTAVFSDANTAVTVDLTLNGPQNTGQGADTLISIENLVGSRFGDFLKGDNDPNGGNRLMGGLGDDTLVGGAGFDLADYSDALAAVSVDLALTTAQNTGHGIDSLSGIESLLGSQFADVLKGDAGANRLDGGLGDDVLTGGLGDDTLVGGSGQDTASYAGAASAVSVDLSVAIGQNTGQGIDSLSGIEGLLGSQFADGLKGDAGANRLDGGLGDDVLTGGLGDDTLVGGGGQDTASYAGAASAVSVDLSVAIGQNTGQGIDSLSGVEGLLGSQFADGLKGDAGANRLDGGLGDDVLTGGLGDDTLVGGGGIDIADYAAAASAVSIDLTVTVGQNTGQGIDILTGIESLLGSQFADVLKGDAGANRLEGGLGDDILSGGLGDDVLVGGGGVDTADYADAASAVSIDLSLTIGQNTGQGIDSLSGIESLLGSQFADVLKGDARGNRLDGDLGDDVLIGGLGADQLTGGVGQDVFRGALADLAGDVITDFSADDVINITGVDLADFTYARDGATLTLSGGVTLSLAAAPTGDLVAASDGQGGVNLTLVDSETVRNDFNGDGRSDLAWREAGGMFSTWLMAAGNGPLAVTPNQFVTGGLDNSWALGAAADFNGDGKSDLLWRNADGAFSLWNSTGTGFTADAVVDGSVSADWALAATGDFNGDGKADLIFRHEGGTFTEWQSTGTGFNKNVYVNGGVDPTWSLAGVGDFNGDGRDDLVWRHDGGTFSLWASTGDGFAANTVVDGSVSADWALAAIADFNGDGKDDLIWRHEGGIFTEWRSNGAGFDQNVYVDARVTPDWSLESTGDFNGDGKADLLWRHDTGMFTVWQSTGDSFALNALVDTSVGPNWALASADYALV